VAPKYFCKTPSIPDGSYLDLFKKLRKLRLELSNILLPCSTKIRTISSLSANGVTPSLVPVKDNATMPPIDVPPMQSNIWYGSFFNSVHRY